MDDFIGAGNVKEYLEEEFGIVLQGELRIIDKKFFLFTGKDLGLNGRYGLYVGTLDKGFRPSIYASQLATKGFTDVDEKQAIEWMCGLDIKKDAKGYYTIIRFGKYILGVGKPKEGRIINNMPKNRRLPLSKL